MTLHDYVRVLRRGWWIVALATLLGLGATAAFTFTTPPTYYATATIYVAISGNETPGDLQQGNVFAVQRVSTYADLALTSTVLDRAVDSLGSGSESELRSALTSIARPDKALIDITARGDDPGLAANQANAAATALTTEASLLDAPSSTSPVRLTVVQAAQTPENADAPRPRNNLLIGLVVGLAVGVALVVVVDAFSGRIRTISDLPRSSDLATRTSIPTGEGRRSQRSAAADARVESFRNLRANLQFGSHAGTTIAVLGVTSASDARTVAQQLGSAWAEIGSVVVVVDVDFRTVRQSRGRGRGRDEQVTPQPGLADVLRGEAELDAVVHQAEGNRLHEIGAGSVEASSAQKLSTSAMADVLHRLAARFDRVLLVCPPLVERSEAAVAAALAGNALVVVESGATTKTEFATGTELLAGVRVPTVSVVIDHVRDEDLRRQTSPPGLVTT